MIGHDNSKWDPIEAARTWEKMGNRKITVLTSASNVGDDASDSDTDDRLMFD